MTVQSLGWNVMGCHLSARTTGLPMSVTCVHSWWIYKFQSFPLKYEHYKHLWKHLAVTHKAQSLWLFLFSTEKKSVTSSSTWNNTSTTKSFVRTRHRVEIPLAKPTECLKTKAVPGNTLEYIKYLYGRYYCPKRLHINLQTKYLIKR